MRPGGMAISCRIDIAVTVLPQPDSPTTQSVSPLLMVMSTPSTALRMPSSVAKSGLQALYFEQRRHQITRRASSASRKPSPMKLMATTAMKMAAPGNRAQWADMSR